MKIYTYFAPNNLQNLSEENACKEYWIASWKRNGWEPVVLNRTHMTASHFFPKLHRKLSTLTYGMSAELTNQYDKISERFLRWCALQAAGGGWMSSYDVVNLELTPEIAKEQMKNGTLHINVGPAYLFYATQEQAANVVKKFISDEIFQGMNVIPECEILNLPTTLYTILDKVKRVDEENGVKRSEVMKSLCSEWMFATSDKK